MRCGKGPKGHLRVRVAGLDPVGTPFPNRPPDRADAKGNGQFLGPDLYFDDLFAMAADKTFMSAEQIVPTEQFLQEGSIHTLRIPRTHVDGVVATPQGAHFTECPPDYDRDEAFQSEYAATARDPVAWEQFRKDWLELESHAAYVTKLAERSAQ